MRQWNRLSSSLDGLQFSFRGAKSQLIVGGSYMAEQGNQPIFSSEFGKIVYILAGFGKQENCRTRKFCILKDRIQQSSNPTDTAIAQTVV